MGGGTYEYFHNTIGKLPVPRRHLGDPAHDSIVRLAKLVQEEQDTMRSTKVPDEQEQCRAHIDAAVEEIEQKVADLFGLTGAAGR